MYLVQYNLKTSKVLGFLDGSLGIYLEDNNDTKYFSVSKKVYDDYIGKECYTNGNIITTDVPPNEFAVLTDTGWQVDQEVQKKVLASAKKQAVDSIDNAVIGIYKKFNPLLQEYSLREKQALAFAEAQYKGNVPHQVKVVAEPLGLTPKQAADNIIAKAKNMHAALDKLGGLRMQKLAVHNMTDTNQINAHQKTVLSQIAVIAEGL